MIASDACMTACLRAKALAAAAGSGTWDIVGTARIFNYCPGTYNDIDVLVLVPDLQVAADALKATGLMVPTLKYLDLSQEWFCSMRGPKDDPAVRDYNVILVNDRTRFEAWIKAADVCRGLALLGVHMDRRERVLIHEMLRDNNTLPAALTKALN